jgi:hypothetical protein
MQKSAKFICLTSLLVSLIEVESFFSQLRFKMALLSSRGAKGHSFPAFSGRYVSGD